MTNAEIIADNVRAVATLYATHQLDAMRLFDVVDRIVEVFLNGQLPVSNDSSGHALEEYFVRAGDRMSAAERWMQYSRVLGASGGTVSKDVAPNTEFDELFRRFLSALAQHDQPPGRHLRDAGRHLGTNATSHGDASAHMAARHIRDHIDAALSILRDRDIQDAWGGRSVWQVVDTVSTQELGATPHVVKHRTMAESGKAILDLLVKNSDAWSASPDKPLFSTGNDSGDISPDDQTAFMRHAADWLAVNDSEGVEGVED